ncbi:MAG: WYL domain-containing protein [Anaerolineae bacterium]|nr:WYL domain-containing protein [Anaerolineae bacterium]
MNYRQYYQFLDALIAAGDLGISTKVLAEHLEVSQETIRNYIKEFESNGTTLSKNGVRYTLPPYFTQELRLSPEQMWLLYLPLRRLVRAQMQRYPMVHHLLNQIAHNLSEEIGDQISGAYPKVEEAIPARPLNNVFKVLVEGWRKQHWVHIRYRPLSEVNQRPHVIAPWWFEPAVWSDSNYLLAGSRQGADVQPLTFKLDRIEWAEMLDDSFERPSAEELLRRIDLTWGIWQRDGEPTTVVLRFDNRVWDRLRETQWHPSEQHQLHEDGSSILWSAQIAEPAEMIPWIRGWGPDVEVLEPTSLREQVAQDAARTAQHYAGERKTKPSFF